MFLRHGFNKETLWVFFTDKVKAIMLSVVIGVPALSGSTHIKLIVNIQALLQIIKWGGTYFYVYCWLFISVFMLFMITIYPTLIAPLFNKFSPLEGKTFLKLL
jgi:STE24 endopeptidase